MSFDTLTQQLFSPLVKNLRLLTLWSSAKNITLAGVNSITLHETRPVSLLDLSAQFFLSEQDLGKGLGVRIKG